VHARGAMVAPAVGKEVHEANGAALSKLDFNPDFHIFNLDLHRNDTAGNLRQYYQICREATDLVVTTSCFSVWKQGSFKNGSAKVIPAVPVNGSDDGSGVRIFFFDDNINLHLGGSAGSRDAKGICNLQDITRGEYVDFSDGQNGFRRESAFRHTLIHHSSEYRNVMVQVNILDAMSNDHYFTQILEMYARAGEKLIVFMDVNGTILWDDSIMGLGPDAVLLSTMMGCIEVRPWAAFDFVWEDMRTVRLEGPHILKNLVHELAAGDDSFYRSFWDCTTCERLLRDLTAFGDVAWSYCDGRGQEPLSPESFSSLHRVYMAELHKQVVAQGMTSSWFRCLDMLREGGHSAVIQSFGMDTRRVVRQSVKDERQVLHLAVNFELWSERDTSKFREQFQLDEPPGGPGQEESWPEYMLGALLEPLMPICRNLGMVSCCRKISTKG